jgi:hypothetical protein
LSKNCTKSKDSKVAAVAGNSCEACLLFRTAVQKERQKESKKETKKTHKTKGTFTFRQPSVSQVRVVDQQDATVLQLAFGGMFEPSV